MISTKWIDKKQTHLRWKFSGHWTARELAYALSNTCRMADVRDYPVKVVLDLQDGIAPDNLMRLARYGFQKPMTQVEEIIVVGYIPTWKSLFSILQHMLGGFSTPVRFVSSYNDQNREVSSCS